MMDNANVNLILVDEIAQNVKRISGVIQHWNAIVSTETTHIQYKI